VLRRRNKNGGWDLSAGIPWSPDVLGIPAHLTRVRDTKRSGGVNLDVDEKRGLSR